MTINFYNDSETKYLPKQSLINAVALVVSNEIKKDCIINIIICSDEYIHQLNKQFLNHDYTTDVITFEIDNEPLEGEIYISVDTAKKQSNEYKCSLKDELSRLCIHGVLHLAGYKDEKSSDKAIMTGLEDKYLKLMKDTSK